MAINYEAMQAARPKQKSALTRAINSGSFYKVQRAVQDAVAFWNANGGVWPDDWSRWQRALDDAAINHNRSTDSRYWVPTGVRLESF